MYKTQIACAIFILFIGVLYFRSAGKKAGSSKWFEALLACSFFQIIFGALDELWKQLSEYQFYGDKQELLEQIHKAIIEFDVD